MGRGSGCDRLCFPSFLSKTLPIPTSEVDAGYMNSSVWLTRDGGRNP